MAVGQIKLNGNLAKLFNCLPILKNPGHVSRICSNELNFYSSMSINKYSGKHWPRLRFVNPIECCWIRSFNWKPNAMAWQSTEIAFALLIQLPRVRVSTIPKYSNKQNFMRSEQRVNALCTAVVNCKLKADEGSTSCKDRFNYRTLEEVAKFKARQSR